MITTGLLLGLAEALGARGGGSALEGSTRCPEALARFEGCHAEGTLDFGSRTPLEEANALQEIAVS